MSARQLPLPMPTFREWELTPFDHELLKAIRAASDPRTGVARSLFQITSRHGLSYWYSLDRLGWLDQLGCIRVERTGQSKPLTIWVTC